MSICETCGLPQDLCVCESIAKETQKIEISIEKKKFNKKYTIISGLDPKDIDLKDLAKQLKDYCACGGTAKESKVELQGDHSQKVKKKLEMLGYSPEQITIKAFQPRKKKN